MAAPSAAVTPRPAVHAVPSRPMISPLLAEPVALRFVMYACGWAAARVRVRACMREPWRELPCLGWGAPAGRGVRAPGVRAGTVGARAAGGRAHVWCLYTMGAARV